MITVGGVSEVGAWGLNWSCIVCAVFVKPGWSTKLGKLILHFIKMSQKFQGHGDGHVSTKEYNHITVSYSYWVRRHKSFSLSHPEDDFFCYSVGLN